MTKAKSTKRALLTSGLVLIMCVTMLIGTTFAWFTDSVTSGRNTIQSGNLDVVLEYWNGTSYEEVNSSTKIFDDEALWEPGYTEVAYLKVSNAGSLALKYQMAVNVYNEILGKTKSGADIQLSNHLKFKVVESDTDLVGTYASREAAQAAPATATNLQTYNSDITPLEPKNEAGDNNYYDYIALIIYMPENVGNEANHNGVNVPSVSFGVNIYATQFTYESDSFDNQYDADAKYYRPEDDGYEVVYIYNMDDFTAFGKAVNNNAKYGGVQVANNPMVWVEVMDNIDMTNAPAIQGTEFSIGNGNNLQFTGVFDGNNHTISNYHITAAWTYNVSLFRTVAQNFTMRDLTFENCSSAKTNNREAAIIAGTIGGGTITFNNVDIKNSYVNGVGGASAYVGKMTEGALYFIDCDVDNVTLTASSATGYNGMFLRDGYSHHDYAESGVWVENCTITNSNSVVNGVQDATIKEYNYTK